jgi:hypothetical protein
MSERSWREDGASQGQYSAAATMRLIELAHGAWIIRLGV